MALLAAELTMPVEVKSPVTMFPLEMTVPAPSEMVLNPFVYCQSNSVKITNEICISDRSRQFELN